MIEIIYLSGFDSLNKQNSTIWVVAKWILKDLFIKLNWHHFSIKPILLPYFFVSIANYPMELEENKFFIHFDFYPLIILFTLSLPQKIFLHCRERCFIIFTDLFFCKKRKNSNLKFIKTRFDCWGWRLKFFVIIILP